MVSRKTNAEAIVLAALELFRTKGYSNTSMADVGRACGLLKGSIYHYFPSKKAIALAVLRYVEHRFDEEIFSLAYRETLSGTERLEATMAAMEGYLTSNSGGCVIHNLALEITNEPEFLPVIRKCFDAWIRALVHIFSEQRDEREARELAREVVARTLGTVLLGDVYGEKVSLRATARLIDFRDRDDKGG
ncbi:TetR/AcrR family transcriptional regulator [Endothiovibrio diazotrophicus]